MPDGGRGAVAEEPLGHPADGDHVLGLLQLEQQVEVRQAGSDLRRGGQDDC
jgi:hypothetical protein